MMIVQGIGMIAQGQAAKAQRDAEAAYLEEQAKMEALAADRETRDLGVERDRLLARQRAIMAARGSIASNTALSLFSETGSEYGRRTFRIRSDSDITQRSLRARASNTRAIGRMERTAAFLGGGGKIAGGTMSLLRPSPSAGK